MTQQNRSKPALLVGITGYMKLDDESLVRERLKVILGFLHDPTPNRKATIAALAEQLGDGDPTLSDFYATQLAQYRPVKHTPIVLLTGLAPGADSIAAEVALEMGIAVQAVLPFPSEQYVNASTFVWKTDSEKTRGDRQDRFQELVRKIGSDNVFEVILNRDLEDEPESRRLKSAVEVDSDGFENEPPPRYERYFAAGEFLTSYCHLLIAVWDGTREGSEVGTSAVVEARLGGPTPGSLPTTSELALAHGGPVFHIKTNRPGKRTSAKSEEIPAFRFLHPYSFFAGKPIQGIGEIIGHSIHKTIDGPELIRQSTEKKVQARRLANSFNIANRLEEFNNLKVPATKSKNKYDEFSKRTACTSEPEAVEQLPTDSSLFQRLRQLSDFRCIASDGSAFYSTRNIVTVRWLFLLTLIAAISLHVFAHWVVKHGHEQTRSAAVYGISQATSRYISIRESDLRPTDDDEQANIDPAKSIGTGAGHVDAEHEDTKESSSEPVNRVRMFAGIVAGCSVLLALAWFSLAKFLRWSEKDEDLRALSEASRVQFYWSLAGTGKSVSANYMQRQRSELDWVRSAIRSASMPYHWWSDQFSNLENGQKIAIFKCVKDSWICDQLGYFSRQYKQKQYSIHAWRKLGFVFSLAGLILFGIIWCSHCSPLAKNWFESLRGFGWRFGFVVLILVGIHSLALLNRKRDWFERSHLSWVDLKKKFGGLVAESGWIGWIWKIRQGLMMFILWVIDHLVISIPSKSQSNWPKRAACQVLNFLIFLIIAYLIASLVHLMAILAYSFWPSVCPDTEHFGIIIAGVLLLCGAMSVAWTEKQMESELSYQYNVMASLFKHASQRMESWIDRLEEANADVDKATGEKAKRLAKDKFDRTVARTQGFLFELGKEALDENAEWLLLHRARPLEPVMAG